MEFTDGTTNWGCPKCGALWQIDSWSDTAITFTVPIPSGTNGEWHVTPGTTATVAVYTATGQAFANLAIGTLQAPAPVITGISPQSAAAGQEVTITGTGFGATQGPGLIQFTDGTITWGLPVDNATWQIDSWTDTAITFTVPTPSGTNGVWQVTPGTTASITVYTAAGAAATSLAITSG